MKVDDSKRQYLCPDCNRRLSKTGMKGKYHCNNQECPVIYVKYARGKPFDKIIRITRAAVAR